MHKKYKTRIGAAMEEFLDLQKEHCQCGRHNSGRKDMRHWCSLLENIPS